MKIKKVLSDLRLIDDAVDQLEDRTDDIYRDYETIEDCETPKCEKEKLRLRNEMGSCLRKLRYEEKMLDGCEQSFHACSGELV